MYVSGMVLHLIRRNMRHRYVGQSRYSLYSSWGCSIAPHRSIFIIPLLTDLLRMLNTDTAIRLQVFPFFHPLPYDRNTGGVFFVPPRPAPSGIEPHGDANVCLQLQASGAERSGGNEALLAQPTQVYPLHPARPMIDTVVSIIFADNSGEGPHDGSSAAHKLKRLRIT